MSRSTKAHPIPFVGLTKKVGYSHKPRSGGGEGRADAVHSNLESSQTGGKKKRPAFSRDTTSEGGNWGGIQKLTQERQIPL